MARSSRFDAIKAAHPRAFEPWRPIDEAIVRAMIRSRAGAAEIAARLGRTEAEFADYLERTGRNRRPSDRPKTA